MRNEHGELWQRLEAYDLERDASPIFVTRLARDNSWARAYAERVCAEYKRFVFLALTAEHPCTPSDEVDQVWHLHLVHTRAYWQRFCSDVLREPLHHGPTRGGREEASKFRKLYEATKASYRAAFGEAPPSDIWPSAQARFGARFVRVDRARAWLVPRPSLAVPAHRVPLMLLAVLTLALAGCALVGAMPPFDLEGSDFLLVFLVSWVASIGTVLALRSMLWADDDPVLDSYEVAYLAGGEITATDAAIAALVQQGQLEVDPSTRRLRVRDGDRKLGHAIEGAVLERCAVPKEGASVATLRGVVEGCAHQLVPALERAGFLLTEKQRRLCTWLALVAPALGVIKIGVGLARDKPVGLLVFATIVTLVVAHGIRSSRHVTAAGKAWLASMRGQHEVERGPAGGLRDDAAIPITLGIALFGTGALAGTAIADVQPVLMRGGAESSDGGCTTEDGGGCDGCGGCGGCD
jgi:uncharacterized protein (TIGR04222 family)